MTGAAVDFVHLRVHSEYSVVDGLCRVDDLIDRAVQMDMPALALTDRSNLFALVKFYDACRARGVKPLLGAELSYFDDTVDSPTSHRCALFAADDSGYLNLLSLVSRAYVESKRRGSLARSWLCERNAGLIFLSGGARGEVGDALLRGDRDGALRAANTLAEAFGDRFYLEVMRTGRPDEERYLVDAVDLATRGGWPIVATNDVCFLAREDFDAHETRVCIQEGRTLNDPRRVRRYSAEQYLKSGAEMRALFADLPEALANSVEIAKRANVRMTLGKYFLPQYPAASGAPLEMLLRDTAISGLEERLATQQPRDSNVADHIEEYRQRLETELAIICKMGFAGYFLIVTELIGWAKREQIPVGPGRGSGAGSLAAYALGITGVDPLSNDLLFERFMNPERVSMPDFDIDFCMEGRDRVIAHVAETYGHDAVGQIITFGTMAAKAVVRDVARVQGKPYGLADRIAKLVPFEVGITLERAVAEVPELEQLIAVDEEVAEIMEMAFKLEGIVRNVGRHAGGVVIAPGQLSGFVPLYTDDAGGGLVSQFDKDDVERAGLVKFDFLGLKTLTVIDWAMAAVNAHRTSLGEAPIDVQALSFDDGATYDLLKRAETTAVFQLESRGMKDLIRRLQPDRFEDIVALVALFRPGPLQSGMVDDFINLKHGNALVAYPHASLEPILKKTYGVILYQEQVMQIAQVLAGFSLGQADLLRRAMGKKKPEEMAALRDRFSQGAAARGVEKHLATHIFDLMEKFAGYGFNKSHSAAYAVVSYQTAWLKAHYPAQFMAAVLSADMHLTDKVVSLVDEVRRMAIPLTPPDVNTSVYRFTAHEGRIVYGLGAIRGVGEGPVSAIVEARAADGPFRDLTDFCLRIDSRKANKRLIEALIRAGAMDSFAAQDESVDAVRAHLLAVLPDAVQSAEQVTRDQQSGMTDMFGGPLAPTGAAHGGMRPVGRAPPLRKRERLEGEKETLGLYLTGHPIDDYIDEIRGFCPMRIAELRADRGTELIAGLVVSTRTMRSRRGDTMAFTVLDDRSGRIELSVFADVFEQNKHKISKDAVLIVEGGVQPDDYTQALKMRVERLSTMDEARARYADRVEIRLSETNATTDLTIRLRRVLEPHGKDGCPVSITYERCDAVGRLQLGDSWRVSPTDELLAKLRAEFGAEQVRISYRRA